MDPPGPESPVVLVKWYDYAKWLLERVENFPKSQRFVLGQRLAEQALAAKSWRRFPTAKPRFWQKVVSLGSLMLAANLAMRGRRSLAPAAGFFPE